MIAAKISIKIGRIILFRHFVSVQALYLVLELLMVLVTLCR
jgi:hypothetical protein